MALFEPHRLKPPDAVRVASGAPWFSRLSAEVWIYRHGWALPITAVLLLLAGALMLSEVQPARDRLDQLQRELLALQSRPPAPPAPLLTAEPEPGQAVHTLLGQAESNAAQVRRIAAIARALGISLPRAQYNTSRQTPSGIEHTDVTLNFVSRYPQARAFIEGVLRELPNVSVDRVSFERDQAMGNEAEVTLRLTLWRWPAASKTEIEAKR